MSNENIYFHGNALLIKKTDDARVVTISKMVKIANIPEDFRTAFYELYYYTYVNEVEQAYAAMTRLSQAINNVKVENIEDFYVDMNRLEITPWQL